MTRAVAMQNTIYVTGLAPEEIRLVRDDFKEYPFPDWQFKPLDTGISAPANLLAGRAILVVGCGNFGPADHSEAMWLLRMLACGCPWVAVSHDADRVTQELCEVAGASAYLTRPFSPARLRELIWHNAVPQVGKTPYMPLTCERLMRYFAVLRADILLKFTAEAGRTGYLCMQAGRPVHARVLDGPDGSAALKELLNWGKGKVLGQPLPADVSPNLPERPEEWIKFLRSPEGAAPTKNRPVPGGREACDRVLRDLPDVTACALVDVPSGRVVAAPSTDQLDREGESEFVTAAADLLRTPFYVADADLTEELAEEVVVLARDGWCAMSRVGPGGTALLVAAEGPAHLGLARQVIVDSSEELERRNGMIVE